MNKKQLHARKRRQFKSLCKQLNQLLQGKHTHTSKQKIDTIILKIKCLLRELSGIIARWEMKKMLGAAAVVFGLSTTSVRGQLFSEPIENPFGLAPTELINLPVFTDLDSDGDSDILVGTYFGYMDSGFVYYENVGNASQPSFSLGQQNPFGLEFETGYAVLLATADLDNDGDMDIYVGTYDNAYEATTFKYYENIGTPTNPSFSTPQNNPFGVQISDEYFTVPTFADLDDDGDFDLLASTFAYVDPNGEHHNFEYYENIGDSGNFQLGVPLVEPFGLSFSSDTYTRLVFPAIADLDLDGDLDILCGILGYTYTGTDIEYGGIFYFENTTTNTSIPQFIISDRNPLGIDTPVGVSDDHYMKPALADLDGDGDVDMLTGAWDSGFHYYENTLVTNTTSVYPDFQADIFPNPTNNYLNINTKESLTRIEIYNLSGKRVTTYDGQQTQISIQDLSSGIYMIRLINQEGQYLSRKIEKL